MSENIWVGTGIWDGWMLTSDHPMSVDNQPVLVNPQGDAFYPDDIIKLKDIVTPPIAADEMDGDVSVASIKRYLALGRFTEKEAVKLKGSWLITRQGIDRVFGKKGMGE